LRMPGMNGIELSRKIKELTLSNAAAVHKSLVTMMTAAEWNAIEKEAREAGVNRFLTKPLFPSAIIECICQCLEINRPSPAEEAPSEAVVKFSGRTILVAEDVDINREIVDALLEPTEIKVDFAENGVKALECFSDPSKHYDAIFMDVQMPEMDGYEATQKIRAIEAERRNKNGVPPEGALQPGIPIIAMTANVFREDIERCLASGMNDHVGKPLDFTDVLDKLRRYIGTK